LNEIPLNAAESICLRILHQKNTKVLIIIVTKGESRRRIRRQEVTVGERQSGVFPGPATAAGQRGEAKVKLLL